MAEEANKKIRYRTESFSGLGERDAAEVMAYETFEMGNTDILYTLEKGLLKESHELRDRCFDFIEELNNNGYVDDFSFDDGIAYFKDVLEEIQKVTGKEIHYALWLADKEVFTKDSMYGRDMEDPVEELDAYEVGSVVLSELGADGTLYGYVDYPRPLKEKIERKFSDLCGGESFEAVDRYFEEQGWKLELWKEEDDFGYQVFFGEGVQVDNLYEYGFPYLYAREEVIGFAESFYETRVKEYNEEKASVSGIYVCKKEDGKWDCSLDENVAGVLLVQERGYPVEIFYSRLDINGSSVMEHEELENREKLVEALKWHGTCNHVIEQIWDFDIKTCGSEIHEFFQDVYQTAMENLPEVLLEEEAGEKDTVSLNEKIEEASKTIQKENESGCSELSQLLQAYVSNRIMAREDIHQFSTGNKVKTRERYIGTVEKVDEEGVHVFNEKNPKNHQHYMLKLEDFKKWVDEGLYRMVAPKSLER